jgi:hypothetical protein
MNISRKDAICGIQIAVASEETTFAFRILYQQPSLRQFLRIEEMAPAAAVSAHALPSHRLAP